MAITVEDAIAKYQAALEQFEQIKIRRYAGTGTNRPYFEALAWARPVGITSKRGGADALIGTITEGFVVLIVSAKDLRDAQFPLPLSTNDKALIKNKTANGENETYKEFAITTIDAGTRRYGGTLLAYEIVIKGQI